MFRKTIDYIIQNKIAVGIIVFYLLAMISVIDWGVPNLSHPYNYHMDEWHQLQSIRAIFEYGTPNVPGAANGTIFQFLLSGLFLSPFVLTEIIDPFSIKASVDSLLMQEKLFEILRLNTLIFGTLSLFVLSSIAKKYFKIHPALPITLFTVTPIWLSLSNYFKYDVALIFWVITSLFYLLKYGTTPTLKNYIIAGVFCSLSVATKISALPLLVIYIFSFFYFNLNKKKRYRDLLIGLAVFISIFLLLGIPDLIFQFGDYREYFYSNLIRDPIIFDNFVLEYNPWWLYVLLKVIPLDFGYVFSGVFFASLTYWSLKLLSKIIKLNFKAFKNEIFMFVSMAVFVISLIPLELGANGNRLLVLLPFFTLFVSLFIIKIIEQFPSLKIQIYVVFILLFIIQFFQSFSMIYVKWQDDPRQLSSEWIIKNINEGSVIGIENIPIYQLLPDLIVKEFYSGESKNTNMFRYEVVSDKSVSLPNIVIITNREFDLNYVKRSSKKFLITRLDKEEYMIIKEFKPPTILYKIMGNEFSFYSSGIVPIWTISIYKQDKNPQN